MCGILGLVSRDPEVRSRFGRALTSLAHRGPDGQGIWQDADVILGHRRLAIIDLSAAADQPMVDPETGAVLIFNGEIYNYREVRDELKAEGVEFRTASDSEVLLKAYLTWGTKMFTRLNGMFAFAVYDIAQNAIFMARDRFGVKPFYYALVDGALLFGSEPKALLALEPRLRNPDVGSLSEFLVHSRSCFGERTFFKDIRAIPPGYFAVYQPGEQDIKCGSYWKYPEFEGRHCSGMNDLEQFSSLFESAVSLRLRSDVPVGLTLSGGLDSSAILAATQNERSTELKCFTSVFSRDDRGEERFAQKAAAIAGRSISSITAETDDWYATLKKIVWHMDSPGYSPAVFPLWNIMRAARSDGVPVLLEGQGADEIFGGYPQYSAYETVSLLGSGPKGWAALPNHGKGMAASFGLWNTARWHMRLAGDPLYRQYRQRYGRARLLRNQYLTHAAPLTPPPSRQQGIFGALLRDHSQNILPSLLHYGDSISMAHGIEARTPFLDFRIVEWVFRTHPTLMRGGDTKIPVRDYLRTHGFCEIAERKDKKGYPTPLGAWLKTEAVRISRELFANSSAPIWQYLNMKEVRDMCGRGTQEYAADLQVYKILTTNIWLEQLHAA